jgi:hypothetical protein
MIPFLDATGLPNQSLTDEQIVTQYGTLKNYYLHCAQHWATYFYRPGTAKRTEYFGNGYFSEYQEIIRNMELFQGRQRTAIFAFMDQLEQGGPNGIRSTAIPIQPGQDSATIFLFLQGVFLSIAATAEPKVTVLNEELKNKMTTKLKLIEVMRVFKEEMEYTSQLSGLKLDVPADPSMSSEKVYRVLSEKFGTGIIKDASRLLSLVRSESMSLSDLSRTYINTIVGRRGVLYVDEEGLIKNIRPESYGYVSVEDDDFGKYDVCRFFFDTIHIDEAIRLYYKTLTSEEVSMLRTQSFTNQGWYAPLVDRYPYQLYNPDNKMIIRGKFFYKSTLDSGLVTKKTEDGYDIVKRARKGRKGIPVQVMKTVTSLGNFCAVDYGIRETIEDPVRKGNKVFPVMHFQPNTFNGYNQSLADRLYVKQQEIDMASNRIAESAALDLGIIISILGDKLEDGVGAAELYAKIREYRIHVHHSSGVAGNPNDRIAAITTENVSLMANIKAYIELLREFKMMLKEIANVNDVTMGTPSEYVGYKTQQGSISQSSNSYQYPMNGVFQLYSDAGLLAIEMKRKAVIKDPTNQKWINLLGEDGVQRILDDKALSFSDWLLSISLKDMIDPARKARMLAFMQNNPNTRLRDLLEFEDSVSITAMKDYADYMDERDQRIAEKNQAVAIAAENEKEAIRAESTVQGKETVAEINRASNKDKILGKLADTKMQQGASDEEVAAMFQGAQS